MPTRFKTRITELFGIDLPVLAGGLQWLSTPEYVAAAAHAGICGFITAASYPEEGQLRDAIRRCGDLANGKPFGVNVSMLPKLVAGERTQAVFDLIVAEGVRFVETSGRNPEAFLPALKAAGVTVIHKVPAVKYAIKAQSIGVDAVAVVGPNAAAIPAWRWWAPWFRPMWPPPNCPSPCWWAAASAPAPIWSPPWPWAPMASWSAPVF